MCKMVIIIMVPTLGSCEDSVSKVFDTAPGTEFKANVFIILNIIPIKNVSLHSILEQIFKK